MPRLKVRLSLLCLALSMTVHAQDLFSPLKTGISVNGRFWGQLSTDGKVGYVIGVAEGISAVALNGPSGCACLVDATIATMKTLYGEKADALYVETAGEIDAFYEEPANRRVAVIDAMKYVAKKMNGATRKELDDYGAFLRKSVSQ